MSSETTRKEIRCVGKQRTIENDHRCCVLCYQAVATEQEAIAFYVDDPLSAEWGGEKVLESWVCFKCARKIAEAL